MYKKVYLLNAALSLFTPFSLLIFIVITVNFSEFFSDQIPYSIMWVLVTWLLFATSLFSALFSVFISFATMKMNKTIAAFITSFLLSALPFLILTIINDTVVSFDILLISVYSLLQASFIAFIHYYRHKL